METIAEDALLYPEGDQHWKQPCTSILQRVIIMPDRTLGICCGMISRAVPEIAFGPIGEKSLEECIVEAHNDLIVNWLALEGPIGIMQFIRQHAQDIPFRTRYVNICHLCGELLTRRDCRAVVATYGQEKAASLGLQRNLYDLLREASFWSSRQGSGRSGQSDCESGAPEGGLTRAGVV